MKWYDRGRGGGYAANTSVDGLVLTRQRGVFGLVEGVFGVIIRSSTSFSLWSWSLDGCPSRGKGAVNPDIFVTQQ